MNTNNKEILHWIKQAVPRKHLNSFIDRNRFIIKFYVRYLKNKKYIQELLKFLNSNEQLQSVLEAEPITLFKGTRGYFINGYDVDKRYEVLQEHFSFLNSRLQKFIPNLYNEKGLFLGNCPNNEENNNIINLRNYSTMRREAELTISIVNSTERLYSISFNIIKYHKTNEYAIAISNLQGPDPSIEDTQQLSKVLTKQCFGYQPRYLLINMAFILAKSLQINHVIAIKNHAHVYQSKEYIKRIGSKIFADYEALWSNYTPQEYDENFVEIFPETRKTIEEISSNKRSMYKKRYAWIDDLEQNIITLFKNS